MGSRIDGPFSYHADEVRCPKCSTTGTITWDASGGQTPQFISLTGEFFERISRKPPYPIELVCLRCGTVQSDEYFLNRKPPPSGPALTDK